MIKKVIFTFFVFIIFSCKNENIDNPDDHNENIKALVIMKGDSIKKNYYKYRNDPIMNDIKNFLNLERIKKDRLLTESIEIINKSEKIFDDFNSYNQTKIFEVKKLLDSLKTTPNLNNDEINEIKIAFNKSLIKVDENRKIDSTVISTYKSLVELLNKNCYYEISENMIYFENDNCLFLYNMKINKIKELQLKLYVRDKISEMKNNELYKKYNFNYTE